LNKSFLKFVTDFGPLAIFFFYYYNNDKNLSVAIPPLIVATLIALVVVWFFEKKMVSEGSWKDYGLNISSRQVSFSVFKNAAENALYKICKNFKPNNKNLKYLITDSNGKIFKNSVDLEILLKNTNWKNLKN
jgi:hypothetical protein